MLIYRLTRCQLSPHDAGQGTGGCRAMTKSLQPCPKRYLLMQLARVAPRLAVYSESMVSLYDISARANAYSERRGQFLRMRIRIRPQAGFGDAVRHAPRVCTLVLFILFRNSQETCLYSCPITSLCSLFCNIMLIKNMFYNAYSKHRWLWRSRTEGTVISSPSGPGDPSVLVDILSNNGLIQ